VLLFCISPVILTIFGFNFGLTANVMDPYRVMKMFDFEHDDFIREILKGRAIHTIVVSFSIAIAFMTMILAFVDFSIKGEVSTPIVGVALFCAGMFEAFHVLISTRLIESVSQSFQITSFTWFFSRVFHALILIIGVGIFLIRWEFFKDQFNRGARRFVYLISAVFVLLTLLTMVILFFYTELPPVKYPYWNIARVYDLIPLALYLIAGLYLFPLFYKKFPSVFSQTLLLSAIPAAAAQLYMAFGSIELFDNEFNISHIMMAFTYFIPFVGLSMNYLQTHQNERRVNEELNKEAKIRKSTEENLAGVLNSTLSGIAAFEAVRDTSGTIVDFKWMLANPAVETVIGVQPSQVIGQSFLATFPYAREEGLLELLRPVVDSGEPLNQEHYSEGRGRWYLLFGTKLHEGVTVTISDISKRKNALLELMKTEKLAVAGRIARTIAHEVRNPLTNINLAISQLKEEMESLPGELNLYVDIVKRNSDRINQLITELMNSSRPSEMEMIVYPVNKLLDDTLNWALDRIRLKSIVLTKDYSPEDLRIRVDVPKMKTALLNIIINAVEAMATTNGMLTLRSGVIGNKCRIEIEDNGHGISKENLEKLFDPFFSVKEKGMGLGLTATQNIILTHNATIDVKSELGKGTRFILVFDRAVES